MSRPERISYEHRSTNSHQVSEQQLLGPEVEQALYDRGAQVLAAVDGEGGQSVVDALADIAPAPAHHVVAFALGDVYARPGLTHAQRQLVTLNGKENSSSVRAGLRQVPAVVVDVEAEPVEPWGLGVAQVGQPEDVLHGR